jgi:hypothetical protein
MEKTGKALGVLLGVVAVWGVALGAGASPDDLKRGCLQATIRAIDLEIVRNQGWIDQRKQAPAKADDLPGLEADLQALRVELLKYRAMDPADYPLPEPEVRKVWLADATPGVGSFFHYKELSRSGPWYHLAGIAGGDFSVLKADTEFQATFYRVHSRNYFQMPSSYVYLAEYK